MEKVLVTGGGSSVGRVMAEKFLARGDAVHVCDVDETELASALAANPKLTGSVVDVGDRQAVARLFDDVAAGMGDVTVLVNNVGVAGPRAAIDEIDEDEWDRTISANLNGMFYCIRRAVPAMKARGRGAIINFSTCSTRTGLPLRAPYIASKAGVEGLTRNLARELGPHGIRCNAILPGIIDNQRFKFVIGRTATATGRSEVEIEADYLRYVSLRTKVTPAELADTVLFLASEAASKITGELIAVSGNMEWEV